MIKQIIIVALVALTFNVSSAQINMPIIEGFDDISTLTDWTIVNNSDIPGSTNFFQGNPTVFSSNSGAADSYLGTNFNATAGTVISQWFISPELEMNPGTEFTYFTRATTGNTFPDASEFRVSTGGASVDVGTSTTSVGDFTIQAVEINTSLATGGYPADWTQFTYTYTGPATTGRVAFRYVISTSAGPTGNNSNYIGFDDFTYTPGAVVEVVPTMGEWGLISLSLLLMIFGVVAIGQRKTVIG